jgi:hypothetical protein
VNRTFSWANFSVGIVLFHALLACSSQAPKPSPRWLRTPIASFKAVQGKWEGLMVRSPHSRRDEDWVYVTLRDNGAYEFASYRTIGVMSGKGILALKEGKLVSQSDKGKLTFELFRDPASDERMLRAQGADGDGLEYIAQLKRTEEVSPSAR